MYRVTTKCCIIEIILLGMYIITNKQLRRLKNNSGCYLLDDFGQWPYNSWKASENRLWE